MKEKHVALVILGVVAILAIVGLILLFKTAKTGAGFISHYEYGTDRYNEKHKNPFPYYEDALHSLPVQTRGYGGVDWDWRSAPDHTYGAKMGRCAILATEALGYKAPAGYVIDANVQQAQGQNCVRVTDSLQGYCCLPPSQS
jgi:hypothetical protein